MYPNTNHALLYQIDDDANYLYSGINITNSGSEMYFSRFNESVNSSHPSDLYLHLDNDSSAFQRHHSSPHPPSPMQQSSYPRRSSSSMEMTLPWQSGSGYRAADAMHSAGPLYPRSYSSVREGGELPSAWGTSPTLSPSQWSSISDHNSYWETHNIPAFSNFPEPEETKPDISHLGSRSPSIKSGSSTPLQPVAGTSTNAPEVAPKKSCSHCHATSTPLWRREPGTQKPLCNACGLYLQQRHKLRPQELIDADADDGEEEEPSVPGGPECSHCHTRVTSVWRRSKTGAQLCNACGVYARLRHRDRPLSLKKNKIKPRSKHPK